MFPCCPVLQSILDLYQSFTYGSSVFHSVHCDKVNFLMRTLSFCTDFVQGIGAAFTALVLCSLFKKFTVLTS